MIDSSKLIVTLQKIAVLTRGANALRWAEQIDQLTIEMATDPEQAAYKCRQLFGGMGSINDLVLMQGGHVLFDANEQLESLRKTLYQELH
jgi:hypothetical protein